MDAVVLDANVAIRSLIPNPCQERCVSLLRHFASQGTSLLAPSLWAYETTSALCKLIQANQITEEEGLQAQDSLNTFRVQLIIPEPDLRARALRWTLRLRRKAAYDSFYLALAEREGRVLWTTDQRLANAVAADWVQCVDST